MASDVRQAATTIVLREAARGFEVLLLRRHGRAGFAARAWVFPGGVVDDADRSLHPTLWSGIDPAAAAPRFRATPEDVLGFHVAAVREAFEESGLLLARAADGTPVDVATAGVVAQRAAQNDRDRASVSFPDWLGSQGLVLALDRLDYFSRWVTPRAEPRRYDTAFFVAETPVGQQADHDRVETTEQRWVSPAHALDEHAGRRLLMIFPTIRTLEALSAFDSIAAVRAAAREQETVRSLLPHMEVDADGRMLRIVHPDDPEYPAHLYSEPGVA